MQIDVLTGLIDETGHAKGHVTDVLLTKTSSKAAPVAEDETRSVDALAYRRLIADSVGRCCRRGKLTMLAPCLRPRTHAAPETDAAGESTCAEARAGSTDELSPTDRGRRG